VDRVGAAEGVVEAVDLLEALVALLVDALTLGHLVEHGGLRLGVVLHKLHVLEDWGEMRLISIYYCVYIYIYTHTHICILFYIFFIIFLYFIFIF